MVNLMSLSSELSSFLKHSAPNVAEQRHVAVAVSGGGDSMALSHALFNALPDHNLHFLTVDHGLRSEAVQEAKQVKTWVSAWGVHETLRWIHEGVHSKIQEDARHARYRLMLEYCRQHDIQTLFLGHHRDDVIETFLMRLTSGSGVDGLASIAPIVKAQGVSILRPFHALSHENLTTYCRVHEVPWSEDPSNDKDQYKRVRFRKAQGFLAEEGLTPDRLSTTIERIARAREALEQTTLNFLDEVLINKSLKKFDFNLIKFCKLHAEFKIRMLSLVIQDLRGDSHYPPRLEKLENLVSDIIWGVEFRKRTFSGCIFHVNTKENIFIVEKEERSKKRSEEA